MSETPSGVQHTNYHTLNRITKKLWSFSG